MKETKGNTSVGVIIGVLIIAIVLVLVFTDGSDNNNETATTTDQSTEETTNDAATAQIAAALSGENVVACQYVDEGDAVTTSYIQGGEIRTVTETEAAISNMIYTDGQIYVWEAGSAEGVVLNEEEADQESNRTPMPVRPSDVEEAAVSGNVSCEQSEVDDTFFDLPTDVEFVALSETDGEMPVR